MIRISAFRSVPPFAQGAVRDFRVRWALEEAGLPYEVRLLGQGDQKSDSYRDLQPFGQVPSFEDGELTLFESGAIVLHIAEKSGALLPRTKKGAHARGPGCSRRSTPSSRTFRSLRDRSVLARTGVDEGTPPDGGEDGAPAARRTHRRDGGTRLSGGSLHRGRSDDVGGAAHPASHQDTRRLPLAAAYRTRCEARPAFKRAIDAQMKQFDKRRNRAGCRTVRPAGNHSHVSTMPAVEPDAPRTLWPCGSARYSSERISIRREAVRLNSFAS